MAIAVVAWAVTYVPLQILFRGYIPADDAKRHAAKVVSGKIWHDILLLRNDITLDSHPGWHALLGLVCRAGLRDTRSLVVFSVVLLSVAFGITGLTFVQLPESWALALVMLGAVFPPFGIRLMSGRPVLVSMTYVLAVCFSWPVLAREATPRRTAAGLTGLATASTFLHGSWYLLVLPLVAFCAARQWRGAVRLGVCTVAGVLIGAVLTGVPARFLAANVVHAWRAFTSPVPREALVDEFQPLTKAGAIALGLLLVLAIRGMRKATLAGLFSDPAALLTFLGYGLGFAVMRFWVDWGAPAFAAWAAMEMDRTLVRRTPAVSAGRFFVVGLGVVALIAIFTADTNGRWSRPENRWDIRPIACTYPDWLPDSGGIFYIHDMRFFYDAFYQFPRAPWRYSVGFEPALMPETDLKTYAAIRTFYAYESFIPWVRKMKPGDRLVLTMHPRRLPPLSQLEWRWFSPDLCIGRTSRSGGCMP